MWTHICALLRDLTGHEVRLKTVVFVKHKRNINIGTVSSHTDLGLQ